MGGDVIHAIVHDLQMWEEVRNRRTEKGLTLDHLSDASGVSKSVLSRLERGERTPKLPQIEAIARALSCSPSDLVSGVSPEPQASETPFSHDPVHIENFRARATPHGIGLEMWSGDQKFGVSLDPALASFLGSRLQAEAAKVPDLQDAEASEQHPSLQSS